MLYCSGSNITDMATAHAAEITHELESLQRSEKAALQRNWLHEQNARYMFGNKVVLPFNDYDKTSGRVIQPGVMAQVNYSRAFAVRAFTDLLTIPEQRVGSLHANVVRDREKLQALRAATGSFIEHADIYAYTTTESDPVSFTVLSSQVDYNRVSSKFDESGVTADGFRVIKFMADHAVRDIMQQLTGDPANPLGGMRGAFTSPIQAGKFAEFLDTL